MVFGLRDPDDVFEHQRRVGEQRAPRIGTASMSASMLAAASRRSRCAKSSASRAGIE